MFWPFDEHTDLDADPGALAAIADELPGIYALDDALDWWSEDEELEQGEHEG